MSARFRIARSVHALALAVTVALPAAPSFAIDAHKQLKASANVAAPVGAVALCTQYAWACARSAARHAVFPADAAATLRRVNTGANRTIRPVSDFAQYAVAERWSLPTRRGGDCEDYALYKKRALIDAGFPPERLLLASVLDRKLRPHAVLVVRMGPTDLVLDNLTGRILSWDRTGYTFLRMQNPDRPDRWVALLRGGALG